MAFFDRITVGDIEIITADTSPIVSGIAANTGSIVLLLDGSGLFIKNGAGNTAYGKTITAANLADITTVGTITSGVWNGTPITDAYINTVSWSKITSTPTTLAGYGITDAVNKGGDTMTGFLTLNADPTNALHAVTKQYVDNFITGLSWKQEVKAATTANIILSGPQTIDGYSAIAGDRILVKNQTTATNNGIYLVAAGAWTRTTDADSSSEIGTATMMVQFGTVNKDTQWTCTNSANPVIGVDNITFGQISGAGTYSAGTGLTLIGTTFAIDSTVVTLTGTQTLTNKSISGATNTLSAIGNASLVNSAITINGSSTSLGGSINVGTVTSVGITGAEFSITGSPVTVSGNIGLALAVQGALTPSTYNNVTVNSKGIVTAASNVAYLIANQTITLSGDVTGSGTTAIATTIANLAVTNAKIANATIDLTTKVTGILPVANGGTGTGTAFTAGSIVFAGASGVYAQNNANFFWDNTNSRLGLGIAVPLSTLHVAGDARFETVAGVTLDVTSATVNTTTATTTTLQSITIPTNTVVQIESRIQARKTGGAGLGTTGDGNSYIRVVKVKNVGGTLTLGTISSSYTAEDIITFNATFDVSGTTVRVRVTGDVNDNVTWTCTSIITK